MRYLLILLLLPIMAYGQFEAQKSSISTYGDYTYMASGDSAAELVYLATWDVWAVADTIDAGDSTLTYEAPNGYRICGVQLLDTASTGTLILYVDASADTSADAVQLNTDGGRYAIDLLNASGGELIAFNPQIIYLLREAKLIFDKVQTAALPVLIILKGF